ncbi:protein TolR [Acidocella sp.]|uniref:protein TolR n=1 Tax=Acidocella sp. TaxID=50710 RepID=UPI00260BFEC0|nr:protein TolR [Acidocella sp.]
MAGGVMGPGGGKKRYRPMAEINVTPLVDVMLVLLIIFMVTAPMITSSVNVNLPKANAAPAQADAKPITISVNAQGQVYLQNTPVDLDNLVATLQQAAQNNPDQRVFVRGDKDVSYGLMIQVMSTIIQGGFTKVSLLAQPTPAGK